MYHHQHTIITRFTFQRALWAFFVCLLLTTVAAAQTFTVPGNSGRHWVDTGLDIAAGHVVKVSATGFVNVGIGYGNIGPGGTLRFPGGAAYPADTQHRFGLVARLTNSRTNPLDEIHEDWAYGDQHNHCSLAGAHLWLTVNDFAPSDNSGSFTVRVSVSKSASCDATTDAGTGVRTYTEADLERSNHNASLFRLNDRVVLKVENDTPDSIYLYNRVSIDQIARGDGLDVQRKEGDQWVEAVDAVTAVRGQRILELSPGQSRRLYWTTNNSTQPGTYRLAFTYYRFDDNAQHHAGGTTVYSETFEVVS